MQRHRLFYFHDPMCSWCWAYRPVSEQLFRDLPGHIKRTNVLGGLAADSDEPMPLSQQQTIAGYWQEIHEKLGTQFNFDFWTSNIPRRSTYPACRAVLAAARQAAEHPMIDAIQQAYYLRAKNPSNEATLVELAKDVGIDTRQFALDIRSQEIAAELRRQIAFSRTAPISGFPSLAIEIAGQLHAVRLDYESAETTLSHLDLLLRG